MNIHHHIINHGPYYGMIETLTDMPQFSGDMRCFMCGGDPGERGIWSIIGDSKGSIFCMRCLCPICARERINGIPDMAEQNRNHRRHGCQGKLSAIDILARLIFWGVLLGGIASGVCLTMLIVNFLYN